MDRYGEYGYEQPENMSIRPTAWQRFWARTVDNLLMCLPMGLIIFIMDRDLFMAVQEYIWVTFPFIFASIETFYEAMILPRFGTTIGKKIFGIRISYPSGDYLSVQEATLRAIKVWLFGLAFGIPGASLIANIVSYYSYNKKHTTKWDLDQSYEVFLVRKKEIKMKKSKVATNWKWVFIFIAYLAISAFANNDSDQSATNQTHQKGYDLMLEERFTEAKTCFLEALEQSNSIEEEDTIYNNLSWACYSLNDSAEALRYSELGLALGSNDSVEYVNYGNALDDLGREEEAMDAYNKAIKLDDKQSYAYHGLGSIAYYNADYEEAIQHFEKSIAIKNDLIALSYLALSHIYNGDSQAAEGYLTKASELDPDSVDANYGWGIYYMSLEKYALATQSLEKAIQVDHENYTILSSMGEAYAYNNQADLAFEMLDQAIAISPDEPLAYSIKARIYNRENKRDKFEEVIAAMLKNNENIIQKYSTAGDLYYEIQEYLIASTYYEAWIELDPLSVEGYLGDVASLYYAKRYTRCLEIAEQANEKFDDPDIQWYMAYINSNFNQSEEALKYYKQALEQYPEDIDLITNIGWEYYYMQDFEQASEWAVRALAIDSAYEDSIDLDDQIKGRKEPFITQIADLMERNYLYFKTNDAYEVSKEQLLGKNTTSIEDVYDLVGTVFNPEDQFTFILSDQEYQEYIQMVGETTIEYEQLTDDTEYMRITAFMPNTSNEFINIIENMKTTEDKRLIIDLRDNYGGDTQSGCNILDYLLGDCVVCSLTYKNGYTYQYYSDAEQVEFNEIVILTNGNSASCSELLTLGLKTYLENVTVVGETTYGKGVGQIGFEDKSRQFMFFLVNHYWNVRETNIMNIGIEPDILVESENLEDYFEKVEGL